MLLVGTVYGTLVLNDNAGSLITVSLISFRFVSLFRDFVHTVVVGA